MALARVTTMAIPTISMASLFGSENDFRHDVNPVELDISPTRGCMEGSESCGDWSCAKDIRPVATVGLGPVATEGVGPLRDPSSRWGAVLRGVAVTPLSLLSSSLVFPRR